MVLSIYLYTHHTLSSLGMKIKELTDNKHDQNKFIDLLEIDCIDIINSTNR
jgi:hypothetical protein